MSKFGIPVRNGVSVGINAGMGSLSLNALAQAILRSFSPNSSSYPFATRQGAYQTSAGPAAVAVNDPIGLELDALGTVGPELAVVPNTGIGSGTWAVSAGVITRNGSSTGQATVDIIGAALLLTTKTYLAVITATGVSGDSFGIKIGTSAVFGPIAADGVYEFRAPGGGTSSIQIIPWGGAVGQATITVSCKEVTGNHATQTTAINRLTFAQDGGGRWYAVGNGTNQWMVTTTGGGASTAFFMCVAFQTAAAGVAQTLWSDRSGNTGLKLEITAGNVIQFSGGNGASINTATGNAVSTGTAYVVTAKYDGANLSVQLNNAAAVTAACTLSAGTAAITIMADPGGASGFFNGGFYDMPYIKNGTLSGTNEAVMKTATGQKAGLVI